MLDKNWRHIIKRQFDPSSDFDYVAMEQFLQGEEEDRRPFYPQREEIFNALNLTPFEKVKVVIIGQDPYHGPGQAHGLCFSVRKGVPIPPSLKNIRNECGIEESSHGDLTKWATQGVLLLNATLTVRRGKAGSHRGKGWEAFTDAIIRSISEKRKHVVFLLWGRSAQKKRALISKNHKVLEASHPSPFSVGRELRDGQIHSFRGCGHFTKTNSYLKKHRLEPIDWSSRLYT